MMKIPIRLADDTVVSGPGVAINNLLSIGPARALYGYCPTIWCVRCLECGINVATFTDKETALKFALWIWNTYGNIRQTLLNCANRCETEEDAAILDAINKRSKHDSRVYWDQDNPITAWRPTQHE